MLGLEWNKLTEGSHMWRLVWWHRRWRVQNVMVAGNERWECLVGDGELLHGTGLDQGGWEAAEWVVLSAEHHRACWELLRAATWDVLASVNGESLRCYSGHRVGERDGSLMHLFKEIHHEWMLVGWVCSRVKHSWWWRIGQNVCRVLIYRDVWLWWLLLEKSRVQVVLILG